MCWSNINFGDIRLLPGAIPVGPDAEGHQASATLPAVAEILPKGRSVVAEGVCGIDDFNGGYRITAERMTDIVAAREKHARRLGAAPRGGWAG